MENLLDPANLQTLFDSFKGWLASNGLSLDGGLWVWTVVQVSIAVTVYIIARLIARRLEEPIENRLRSISGKPRLLRFLAVLFRRLHWIMFTVVLWSSVAIMRASTWPSRSYFLGAVATLATAWIVISVLSRIIRNKFVANVVAISAWSVAALNIFGLLTETLEALDAVAFQLDGFRLSLLLVIKGLLVGCLLIWGALGLSQFAEKQLQSNNDLTPSVRVLLGKILRATLLAIAVLVGLNVVGIDLTALAVFSGALGLGLGFGLQKIVSNLISGIILLLDKSIKPGDVIEIETVSGTTYGWVQKLAARYTSVRTRDGTETLFPNETFIANPVTNWSHTNPEVRQKIPIGVAYNSDVELAIKLCIAAASEHERVLKQPPPVCLLKGFGDSSVDLELRFWIRDPRSGLRNIASEILLAIWKSFREHEIEIPFPQRDMHIRTVDSIPVNFEPQESPRPLREKAEPTRP